MFTFPFMMLLYDENHEMGDYFWKQNETQIFAQLYFDGPYAGHGGSSAGKETRTVKTEFALLTAGLPKPLP